MRRTTQTFRVAPPDEGARLDRFLAAHCNDRTRSYLGRAIRQGCVRVDGVTAPKVGMALRSGMTIELDEEETGDASPRPEVIPLERVFEDDDLVVVVKPAGMIVHAGHGQSSGTLVNALLGLGLDLARAGGQERPGIVHRLDQGTSGLLVVAKSDSAHLGLCRAFAARKVRKRYTAIVWGRPRPSQGRIERPIGRSRTNPTRMSVEGVRGRSRPALTAFRTRTVVPGFAWLDLDLHTGRTHQIRVHLQSLGHPIVGDDRYGGRAWRGVQDPLKRKALREFDRLALHAAELAFPHPRSGVTVRCQLPPPQEFVDLWRQLGGPA